MENCSQSTSQSDADEDGDNVILIPAPEPLLVNLISDDETEEDDGTKATETKAKPTNRPEFEIFELSSDDESDDDFIDLFVSEDLLSGILSDCKEDKHKDNKTIGNRSENVTENASCERVGIPNDSSTFTLSEQLNENELKDVVEKSNEVDVGNDCIVIDLCEPDTLDASSSETKAVFESDDISDGNVPLSKRIRQQKEMKSSEVNCFEHEPKEASKQRSYVTPSTTALNSTVVDLNISEKCEPVQLLSHVVADSTTATNETIEKSEKIICLTQHQYKQLVSEKGNKILRDIQLAFDVSVRLEWHQNGNVLIVHGTKTNQEDFCNVLQEYSETLEIPQNAALNTQFPSDRDAIICYVRSQVAMLDSAMCNFRFGNIGDMADLTRSLFNRIRQNGTKREKAKESMCLRQHLNMILFGRYGLDQGKYHLNALQGCFRRIIDLKSQNVPLDLRARLNEHMEYIFSGVEHQNYEATIDKMKRYTSVPMLNLDRKLLGLELDAWPSYSVNTSQQGNSYNFPPPPFGVWYQK